MENPRTASARDHDDRDIVERDTPTPTQQSSSGGNLARDVASQAEEDRIADPEAHRGPEKEQAIDNDTARAARRRPDG